MENSFKQQIHQIQLITVSNGKPEYCGRTFAKNDVVLEPDWSSDAFEFCEPGFYKPVTKVTRDDDSKDIYTVPVEQCNIQTSVEESKHEEKLKNAIIVTGLFPL